MENEELWIKRSIATWGLGTVTAIMTKGKSGQRHIFGEYFVLISGAKPVLLSQRTSVDTKNFPPDLIKGNFIKDEIEQQVQGAVSRYFYDQFEDTQNNFYLQKIELLNGDKRDLMHLWVRGEFQKEIKSINQNTNCNELKSYLGMIVELPVIDRTDWSEL